MRVARIAFLAVLALVVSAVAAAAADVRVLSVGSTSIAAKAIAAQFTQATGHQVSFTIRPPFAIDKELAEKIFDVVIISVPAMDLHDRAGSLQPGSRTSLARVGVGVVVKEGTTAPDVSTPEAFKAAVLAARSLTHGDPALPNTAGAIAVKALEKLGIADAVKGKTRHSTLAAGAELVIKGEVEMGFYNVSEIPKGLTLAGPLPGTLQGYTVYEAAVLARGSKDEAASAFARFLASPLAAAIWRENRLEPAAIFETPRASL